MKSRGKVKGIHDDTVLYVSHTQVLILTFVILFHVCRGRNDIYMLKGLDNVAPKKNMDNVRDDKLVGEMADKMLIRHHLIF